MTAFWSQTFSLGTGERKAHTVDNSGYLLAPFVRPGSGLAAPGPLSMGSSAWSEA